jgi:HK97 family phage portal protein
MSIVQYARQVIGTQLARDRQQGLFYGNGMKPSVAFTHPGQLSLDAQKRLVASMHEEHGQENAGGTIVLEEGMKLERLSLSAEESQTVEMAGFGIVELCRYFRMPPHKVAELTRATFSNITHQAIEYVQDTLMSWGERWNAAMNQQVIVTSSVQAEILFDALLKGTTLERYQAHRIAAGGPWLAPNEVRAMENRPSMDGLDDVRLPLNTGASGSEQGEPREAA